MHTHAINHQGQLVMMLNHIHLGLIQFRKQINSEGTYFGGVLSAACWCWLNIGAWRGRHAAFITLPLSSSLLRGYIFKVNDSMLKGLLCCLETLETTTACTWARHTRKTSEKWKWEGWIWVIHFQEQGSSSKRRSKGVAWCFFKWHWNRMCMEESWTGSYSERFSGGQSGSGFLWICFHHNLNATFKVNKGFCTTSNGSSVKALFPPCKITEMSLLITWKAFQKFCFQLLSTCNVANLSICFKIPSFMIRKRKSFRFGTSQGWVNEDRIKYI